MPAKNLPFILNVDAKVAHMKPTREECNADQIVHKRNAAVVPQNYHKCEHCFGGQE